MTDSFLLDDRHLGGGSLHRSQPHAREPAAAPLACRSGCGACCIAPSISTPMPRMPHGKPAGVACAHLSPELRCELFGTPQRPAVCASLRPGAEMCGRSRVEALAWLARLEEETAP